MDKLTSQQEKLLDKIKQYVVKNGYAPTVRELCKEMGKKQLKYLRVDGYRMKKSILKHLI